MLNLRTGKIARLPLDIRAELNRRLQNGASATKLLAWLNALPAVRAILKEHFHSRSINAVNLSKWTHAGYRDWLHQQDAHDLAHTLAETATGWAAENHPPLTDAFNHCLTARLTLQIRRIAELAPTDPDASHKLLRQTIRDLAILQRTQTQARRQQHQHDHLAFREQQARDKAGLVLQQTIESHEQWALHPDNHDHVFDLFVKTYPNDYCHGDDQSDEADVPAECDEDIAPASEKTSRQHPANNASTHPPADRPRHLSHEPSPPPQPHASQAAHTSHSSSSPSHPDTPSPCHSTPPATPASLSAHPAERGSSPSPGRVFCHTTGDYVDLPGEHDSDTADYPLPSTPGHGPSSIAADYTSSPTVTSEGQFYELMRARQRR